MNRTIRRRPEVAEPLPVPELHPILAGVYARRGISAAEELELTLDQLCSPADMLGLDRAATLLADHLCADKAITIVGDFDADGATSSVLSLSVLRAMGASRVAYLVPNRFDYGYGLTPEIVELAAQGQPELIVTVDNGISSIDGVEAARERGIRTLITDHHLPGKELPAADVIVNPSQPGCQFPSKNLAGVGVIFYVMSALRAELRSRGWFEQQGIAEPRLAEVLDLVALGTVADVVPLDRNNRILVEQGLKRIRAGYTRPGIKALLEVGSRSISRLVASDLAFAVAPRLNASGRLDDISTGIECLLAETDEVARRYATELDHLNRDRQQIEQGMQVEALKLLDVFFEETGGVIPSALCLYDSNWHQGVVGILASRIKDRLHRPVIAFADADNGEIKGSARSIPGLHIRDALDLVASHYPGVLTKFGGHAMAAGLSLPRENLERFRDAFEFEVEKLLEGVALEAVVESDGELHGGDFNLPLARELRFAGPWGQHFPEPIFDGEFELVQQRIVGEKHLKMVLRTLEQPGQILDAIAFNIDTTVWPNHEVERVRLAYRLDSNVFRGQESLQLMVELLEPA